jgi:Ca-activated chloride channel family protein
MRRSLLILPVLLAWTAVAQAHGIRIPEDKTVAPLAMLSHQATIAIDDQVAVTKVAETFRNQTDQQMEATYVFPVPRGAVVNQFSLWINDKEIKGEVVAADQARDLYTSIIRRTQNPALLEYLGSGLLRVRVAAIPAKSDQKLVVSYTSVADRAGDAVEYIYPLKANGNMAATLQEFSITANIKSQHAIQNVYSPSHAITIKRANDKELTVSFDRNQGMLDKDFQLFYSFGTKDIGLTALTNRPAGEENGHFLMLIAPRLELAKEQSIPRDMVLVLDTSGSMRGVKLAQAKKAMKFCLSQLTPKDRFGMIEFSAKVNKYKDALQDSAAENLDAGRQWVDHLQATGGTNINDALIQALAMRSKVPGRAFTIVFFTDGLPTSSERDPEKILKNVASRNDASTRIFSFGVGDDVNATFLDRLAEQSRGFSTYVRPSEDIEVKVAGLYSKISHPVLANLQLAVGPDVTLEEVYPPQLPDLFHGTQLVVLGRYRGHGPATVKLTGTVGMEAKEYTYSVKFAEKTNADREFVEQLWARRKVGYLLDQIRVNGAKKELVDEVTALAKKYGIVTPYTSYLIVTDGPAPVARERGAGVPEGLAKAPGAAPLKVLEFAKEAQNNAGDGAANRGNYEDRKFQNVPAQAAGNKQAEKALQDAKDKKEAYDQARAAFVRRDQNSVQNGKLGVDLSLQTANLRNLSRMEQSALRRVGNRNCLEIGGVWIDEGYDAKTPTVAIKAMSDAYFRMLERQPQVKEVFQLGNHLVWLTPSGTALVIDAGDGAEKLSDAEIDKLFVAKK